MSRKILVILFPVILVFTIITLGCASAYSSNVTLSTTQSIGTIRSDFYGYLVGSYAFGNSTNNVISNLSTKMINNPTNHTWHKNAFILSGANRVSMNSVLRNKYFNSSDGSVNRSSGSGYTEAFWNDVNATSWFINNGYDVIIILDQMPQWLANLSADCDGSFKTCPPNNWTQWYNIVIDYINITSNNGEYNVSYTLWNEPNYATNWIFNLSNSNITSIERFIQFYNNTYYAIKTVYPDIQFGGFSGNEQDSSLVNGFREAFIGNVSFDFYTYNTYWDETKGNIDDYNRNILNNISQDCIGCSRIINIEWKMKNVSVQSDSEKWNIWKSQLSQMYITYLNYNPVVYGLVNYMWADQYLEQNSSNKPFINTAVSEPRLNNTIYPPYNITKLFATNHKAGNTVYNSSSSNSSLKVVMSKDSTRYYITLTNTLNENLAVKLTFEQTGKYLRDVETNDTFLIYDNGVNTTLTGYAVKTYDTRDYTTARDAGYVVYYDENGDEITRMADETGTSCNSIIAGLGSFGTYFTIIALGVVLVFVFGVLGLSGNVDPKILTIGALGVMIAGFALVLGIQLENYFCEIA